jgi:hypothetical protein
MYEEVMGEYYDWYDKNPEESKSLDGSIYQVNKDTTSHCG